VADRPHGTGDEGGEQRQRDDVGVALDDVNEAVDLAEATRRAPEIRLGASPRATLQLLRVAKAWAALDGREYVIVLGPGQSTPAPWLNVVANPRPFIKTATYFGPDRRRLTNPSYIGPERRKGGIKADVIRQAPLLDKVRTQG